MRIINRSDQGGEVAIAAIDDAGRHSPEITLAIGANETAHFNSDDLEQGATGKGLSGGTGSGQGDWRLELTAGFDIEVLAYIRTGDSFLTAMHDVVEGRLTGHRVAIFNPGRNQNQVSLLRLINPGAQDAEVEITAIDDGGTASGSETGATGAVHLTLTGELGEGAGKWRLLVSSDQPVVAMSLLKSPTGHLTNLSTAPNRAASGDSVIRQVTENAPAGQAIGDPVTADFGADAVLMHSLEGPDAESFAIDAPNGQLSTRDGAVYDFEVKSAFELIVKVTDELDTVVRVAVTVEVTDVDEPPARPVQPEVEGVSSRSVRVSWEEPDNTGPEITDYDVSYRRPGAAEHTDAEHEGVEREIEIGPLRSGTDYEFRVRASNAEGIGDWSEPTIGRGRSGGGGGGGGGGTTPPPNQPPVFQGPSSFTLPENRKEVGTVRASNATTYTIADSGDGAGFRIDDAGALQFHDPPDYERPTDVAISDPPDDARNNTYLVGVVATRGTGADALSTTATVTVTDTAFEAPEITRVTVLSSTEISVSWRPRDNAGPPVLDYDLQYRAAGDRDFTDGGHRGLSTSATLGDLSPATDHEIQVRAVNGNGPSQWSASTTATTDANRPPTFGTAPIQRTLAENTDAGTNIGAPLTADDPDRDQLAYRLGGRDAASFDLDTDSAQLKTRTGIDYDFEKKTRYELTVTADDGHGGRAGADVEVTVADLSEPPGEVARPTVRASTLSSLTIDWTAPANTGPRISDYDYRYRRDSAGQPWTEVTNTELTDTEVQIVNLMAQTPYRVEVLAKNDEGDSGWSEPARGTTADNQAPGFHDGSSTTRRFPENTTGMHDIGNPVEATDSDGGTLEYSLVGAAAGLFDLDTGSGQLRTRPTGVYNHEEGARHDVTVRVVDGQGGSAAIDVAIEVTDVREPPARPDEPSLSTLSSKRLMVRWTAPDNTGPAITDYDYRYRASSGWTTVSNTTLTDTEVEIEGLTPDTDYDVQVLATNDEGSSTWSDSGTATTHPNQAPVFAEGATARRALAENTTAQSDFGAPVAATDGNDDELTYRLGGTDASRFALAEDSGQLSTRSGFVPNHEDKADYSVTVTARDDQGSETSIDVTVGITDLDEPPAPPVAPRRASGTSTTLRMTWPAPTNTGPAIDDYDYRHRKQQVPEQDWTHVTNTTIATPEITLEDLHPDTTYEVEARAHNEEGTSLWGATGSARTTANRAPTFDEGSSTSRSLPENTAGFTDIGSPVAATDRDDDTLTYALEGTDAASFRIDPTSGQLITRGIDYDHESESSYAVTVNVKDQWGAQDTIPVTVAVTDELEPPAVPGAPTAVGTSPSTLEVRWSEPANAGRPLITGYGVQFGVADSGSFRSWTRRSSGTTETISGLDSETTYEVQVLARNAEGSSDWSFSGRGTTLTVVPTVESVSFTSDSGTDDTYKDGDTIAVTVTFSEDVTVDTTDGDPGIDLVIGSTTRVAAYESASGAAVVFEYEVEDNDRDTDGASLRANSLDTNGGSIREEGSSLDANLAHGGVTNDADHQVDGVAPGLSTAIASGDRLTLVYNETLASTPLPATGDFSVLVAGASRDVSSVAIATQSVALTLASAVTPGQTVSLTYAGTGTNPLRDLAGNPAPALGAHPVDNESTGVCSRTPAVRDAIVRGAGVGACADVTLTHLQEMRGLSLNSRNVSSLKDGDFDGLSALLLLDLGDNALTDLPAGIFSGLTSLFRLDLKGNRFSTLPSVFGSLSALTWLDLIGNDLSSLPSGVFSGLTALETLRLSLNDFATLPADAFSDVTALTWIELSANKLATPSGQTFSGLSNLETLYLRDNDLASLPDGLLSGLTALERLDLRGNPADPLPVAVTLELSGGEVRASIPAGAPFDVFVPIVVRNGSLDGGATGVTVAQGDTESGTVGVTRSTATAAAVTADIGELPEIPETDTGYILVPSDDLPLEVGAAVRAIVLHPSPLTVREGGTNAYTVALQAKPSGTVTVTVTAPTGLTADTSPLTFTTDDWNTQQTVTLTAAMDADTQDTTLTVAHRASDGGYAGLSASLTVTVAETVPDTNANPSFTSAAAFTMTENGTAAGTVAATDGDTEDSVTGFTLDGADGALFQIGRDGVLAFVDPPDFETPADSRSTSPANDAGNNEYIVRVTAVSGAGTRRRTAAQTITVTVQDADEPPGPPPTPDIVRGYASSSSLTVLAGRGPIHNAGPEITAYDAQFRAQGVGMFEQRNRDGARLYFLVTDLEPATTYEIQVRAGNDEGVGPWSAFGEWTTGAGGPPVVRTSLLPSGVTATAGGAALTFVLQSAFVDPEGEYLWYEASSANPSIATAAVEGYRVVVRPLSAGIATIGVTAHDPQGESVEGTFTVNVSAPTASDPTASFDGAGDTLTLTFTDDFALDEARAYEATVRQKTPRGGWAPFCFIFRNAGSARTLEVSTSISVADVAEPGIVYETVYRYLGSSCDDTSSKPWSRVAESTAPGSESFDIDIVFVGSPSSTHRSAVEAAARIWEQILTTSLQDVDFSDVPVSANACMTGQPAVNDVVDDLRIFARLAAIDGVGGTYALGGYCSRRLTSGLPVLGMITLDVDDFAALSSTRIRGAILHEIAHALGFGIVWRGFSLLRNPSIGPNPNRNLIQPSPDTHFAGPLAVAAFEAAGGSAYADGKVPVENTVGGVGSRDSHWRESVVDHELMTPYLNRGDTNQPLSAITVQSMADMGYGVNVSRAEAYSLPTLAPPLRAAADDDAGRCIVTCDARIVEDHRPQRIVLPPHAVLVRPSPTR